MAAFVISEKPRMFSGFQKWRPREDIIVRYFRDQFHFSAILLHALRRYPLKFPERYFISFQNATIRLGKNYGCRHRRTSRRPWCSGRYVWRLGDGKLQTYDVLLRCFPCYWFLVLKFRSHMVDYFITPIGIGQPGLGGSCRYQQDDKTVWSY